MEFNSEWASDKDCIMKKNHNGRSLHVNGRSHRRKRVLITGGAGFIGTNLANRLLCKGAEVIIYDNMSRPGVDVNVEWLREVHGDDRLRILVEDTRDAVALADAVAHVDQIFHFAAQVAVTTSLLDPITDFEINVRGTLNLLEAMRHQRQAPSLLFASTNKVYGEMQDLALHENKTRYKPSTAQAMRGVGENRPLDFHSPYGCSKGAADQYVIDYARIYQLPTVVFRMSCIYGPHQMGTEDQGWVAHFLIRKLRERPITIYGNGKQVRDVLYVDDLVDAFLLAQANMGAIAGQAFNIGGGAANTISLMEMTDLMRELDGDRLDIRQAEWRPGDQKYYVTDHGKFSAATGWRPTIAACEGIERLYSWLRGQLTPAGRKRKEMLHGTNFRSAKAAGSI